MFKQTLCVATACAFTLFVAACEELPDTTPDPTRQCKPGVYEGKFEGWYTPTATVGLVPVPIGAEEGAVEAGFRFVLDADPENPGKMIARAGCIQGLALSEFPFHARMSGNVDCSTARLTGSVDGWYDALGIYYFKGPLEGLYDAKAAKFVGGTWKLNELDENNMNNLWLGGDGTWNATWVRDVPAPGTVETCYGF